MKDKREAFFVVWTPSRQRLFLRQHKPEYPLTAEWRRDVEETPEWLRRVAATMDLSGDDSPIGRKVECDDSHLPDAKVYWFMVRGDTLRKTLFPNGRLPAPKDRNDTSVLAYDVDFNGWRWEQSRRGVYDIINLDELGGSDGKDT